MPIKERELLDITASRSAKAANPAKEHGSGS
jgi:hypothetical protein